MIAETDLGLDDGRTLHVYDTGPPDAALAVFWHHGTPNTGTPPEPLFGAAAERGIRWISHDRPGYGSSAPQPGRDRRHPDRCFAFDSSGRCPSARATAPAGRGAKHPVRLRAT